MKEMIEFYHSNKGFRDFVDANAEAYRKDVSFILSTPITREYYLSLQRGGCNEQRNRREDCRSTIEAGCNGATAH